MFMFFSLAIFILMACDSESEEEPQLPLVAEMVEDLSAPNDVIDRSFRGEAFSVLQFIRKQSDD